MILSTHALVGAALGSKIENLFILIPLVLAVHYFLDGFRHGEYIDDRKDNVRSTWWKIGLDLTTGFLILLVFFFFQKPDLNTIFNILIGSFFSIFPDLLSVFYFWRKDIKIINKIKKFHSWAHHYSKYPKYSPERQWKIRNIFNDILISSLAIASLFI